MKNLILFGSDFPLLRKNLTRILNEFSAQERFEKIVFHSHEDLSFLSEGDLFGTKKVFLLFDLDKKYFPEIKTRIKNHENPFIFIFNQDKNPLAKILPEVETLEFNLPKNYQILKTLQTVFYSSDKNALNYLSYFIQSLEEIDEIKNKMDFYRMDKITLTNLRELLPYGYSFQNFLLEEAILNKQTKIALTYIQDLFVEKVDLSVFVFSIQKKLKELIKIKEILEKGGSSDLVTKTLGYHPFYVKKLLEYSHNFSKSDLKTNLASIFQTEFYLRTNKPFSRYYVEKFILSFK